VTLNHKKHFGTYVGNKDGVTSVAFIPTDVRDYFNFLQISVLENFMSW